MHPNRSIHPVKNHLSEPQKVEKTFPEFNCLDVPGRKLGSMVRINGLFHLLVNGVFLGVITHLITNLLLTSWDIQVGWFLGEPC